MDGGYDFFATRDRQAGTPSRAADAAAPWDPGAHSAQQAVLAPSRPTRRPSLWVVLVAVGVVAALVAMWMLRPRPHDGRPVVMPATLGGLAPNQYQFADDASFRTMAEESYGGAPWGGLAYGTLRTDGVQLNVLAARTDGDDLPDVRAGRAPWTQHGEVRCTRSMHYEATGATPALDVTNGSLLLCVRQRETLTVSALVFTTDPGAYEPTAAQLVDEAWAAVA